MLSFSKLFKWFSNLEGCSTRFSGSRHLISHDLSHHLRQIFDNDFSHCMRLFLWWFWHLIAAHLSLACVFGNFSRAIEFIMSLTICISGQWQIGSCSRTESIIWLLSLRWLIIFLVVLSYRSTLLESCDCLWLCNRSILTIQTIYWFNLGIKFCQFFGRQYG